MIKSNKTISYVTFILKEIYEYANIMTEDGVSILTLRDNYVKFDKMRKFLFNIEKIFNEKD